ncbi:MAG: hypothetical protein ACREJD_05735 [Phycisphaerales bacterium]
MLVARGIDDGGKPVWLQLSNPADLPIGAPMDGTRAGAFVILRIALDAIRSRAGWYIVMMLVLFALDGLALWVAGPFAMFLVLSSPIASIVLVLLVNAVVGVGRVLDERKQRARELWLEAGRCPCCGYALLAPDPATEVVANLPCAECGASWRPLYAGAQTIIVRRTHVTDQLQVLA